MEAGGPAESRAGGGAITADPKELALGVPGVLSTREGPWPVGGVFKYLNGPSNGEGPAK